MSDSLQPYESQHARPPCPSPTLGVYPNSCPSSWWCHPTISSSVVPFSSCPQSLPASGSFPMSQLFTWGGQSIGVSASTSVPPKNTQDWSPLGWTGWISLLSRGLSRVFKHFQWMNRWMDGCMDWWNFKESAHIREVLSSPSLPFQLITSCVCACSVVSNSLWPHGL